MSEREQQILFDYDNHITNGAETRLLYQEVFLDLFSRQFNLPLAEIIPIFEREEMEIRDHPHCHIFSVGGYPVGSLGSDHILRTRGAAMLTLIKWHDLNHKPGLDELTVGPVLTELYKQSYAIAGVVYNDEAIRVTADLQQTGRFTIESGSDGEIIRKQLTEPLKQFGVDSRDLDIHGNVKKSHIDLSQETHKPESIQPKDFPHPVYLRRPLHAQSHRTIPRPIGVSSSDTLGDLAIFEGTDTATFLLKSEFLSWYEEAYYANHPSRRIVKSFTDLRDAIDPFV